MIDITPTRGFPHMYDFIGDNVQRAANPIVLIAFIVVIILYYVLFSYLGLGGEPTAVATTSSPGITIIEIVMWGMFVFLLLINGLQYFFEVDIKTGIKNLFTPVPEIDIAITTSTDKIKEDDVGIPEITRTPQVFHVPNNIYTLKDAKAVCKAYGGELADYKQIEDAYKKGGEWCGFGWSKDQMALYPTQPDTWKKLQTIPEHKHDCGRPGINGGYIANENVRFGANCYGFKPKMTPLERKMLDNTTPFPKTKKERRFEKLVDYYKKKLPNILIAPFNYDKWSIV